MILKHIFEYRCTVYINVYSDIYPLIHCKCLYSKKDKSKPFFKNLRWAILASRLIVFGKIGTFPSNSRKVEVRLFIFFPAEDRFIYFHHFQSQSIYFQDVLAPTPQNQMGIPLLH